MNTFSAFIYFAFAIAVVVFAYTFWRQSAKEKRPTPTSRRAQSKFSNGSAEVTTGAIIHLIPRLRDKNAQWPEIMDALNPNGEQRIAELLQAIRGPHMFDPRTALNVIEDGCRTTAKSAPVSAALAAAVDSMNKVVGFGR
jgi:hypothetical protein